MVKSQTLANEPEIRVVVDGRYTYWAPADTRVGDRVVVGRELYPGAGYEEIEARVTAIGSEYRGWTRRIVRRVEAA